MTMQVGDKMKYAMTCIGTLAATAAIIFGMPYGFKKAQDSADAYVRQNLSADAPLCSDVRWTVRRIEKEGTYNMDVDGDGDLDDVCVLFDNGKPEARQMTYDENSHVVISNRNIADVLREKGYLIP